MEESWDVIKILIHIYSLIVHYYLHFHADIHIVKNTPDSWKYLFLISATFFFSITFVLNGINSGRWFTKNKKYDYSFWRKSCKFYCERLAMIIPITYIYYFIFTFSILYIFEEKNIKQMLIETLIPNIFLISNYVSIEKNVIFNLSNSLSVNIHVDKVIRN